MPAVVLGLSCGIVFLLSFAIMSNRIPVYLDSDAVQCGTNEPIHMSFTESLRIHQTMLSPYEISKATWRAIPLDDKVLSAMPLIKEALVETSERQPGGGDTASRRIVSVSEFKSILQEMPNQERIGINYENEVHDGNTGTIRQGIRVWAPVLYNDTLYIIQAFCFSK